MKNFDIIVVGSGIAGLTFAFKIAPYVNTVCLITKKSMEDSNTNYAQGGIAAVFGEDDSFELHIKDTIETGRYLSHKDAVEIMVMNGPKLVMELKELGAKFEIDENGKFKLGKEGGHSKRRIVHAGDYTGYEIEKTLIENIKTYNNVLMFTNHFVCDLIVDENNLCQGVYVLDVEKNEIEPYFSQFVVIATGGCGQVYKFTTNPMIATGDGIAISYLANAKIANMEFFQFHPTALYNSEEMGRSFLISEAVRGEGAFLKLKDNRQFMHKYSEKKSLAPRDIVARAIDNELKLSGEDFVYLDLSPFTEKKFKDRFPKIYEKCKQMNINVPYEPIPVVPAAHYSCGGIYTDTYARSSIKNLYAIGEAACTGVHGANRLASNSLLEALVFADQAFRDVREKLKEPFETTVPGFYSQPKPIDQETKDILTELRKKLKEIMWKKVSIVKTVKSLKEADEQLNILSETFFNLENYNTVEYFEVRNMIIVSKIIINSALKRKESRGLHFVKDYPEEKKEYLHDTIIQKEVL
ncbi:MAG: L-aspartate oxidase [candidate division WOR-3 bacterium]